MRRAWLTLVLILLVGCSKNQISDQQQHPVKWYNSIEDARQASEQTKSILLSFEAVWCPWCKVLRESVYADPTVMDSLIDFVCVIIDADQQDSIVAEYGVSVFPTIVITDFYGNEHARLIGLYSPGSFLKRLHLAKNNVDIISEMYAQESSNQQDPLFQLAFGRILAELGIYDGAILRFEKAAQMSKTSGTGVFEEATYSIAETFMLKRDYKRAAEEFRRFVISFPEDQRAETGLILAARCYEVSQDLRASSKIYREYFSKYPNGSYALYASNKIKNMK